MHSNSAQLRLLVLADFALADKGPTPVETTDVDSLLGQLVPTLDLQVPNRLIQRRGETLDCSLRWPDLASFAPAGVASQILAVKDLQEARRQVEDALATSAGDLSALFEALPASVQETDLGRRLQAQRGPATGAGDRVSSLLDQVQIPGEEPAAVLTGLRDEIDRRLTRQLSTILSAPRLQAVEAAWRSLAFLLAQGAAESMAIELLSSPKAEFLDTFFEQDFHREYEGRAPTPLAAVVLGYAFDRSLPDLERLGHVARMGESLRVPFFAAMGPGYFGLKRLALVPNLPDLPGKSRGAEYAKWNSLRDREESLWLALTINRFLLRDAWGSAETTADGEFKWIEATAGSEVGPLWGEASWALGAVLAQALGQGGLSLPMTAADLNRLPCRSYGGRRGEPFPYPLEVRLLEDKALEIAECGLLALVAEPGQDQARFPYLPTYHRARNYTTEEATRSSYQAATLPYQLFAALASRQLQEAAEALPAGLDDDGVQQHFEQCFSTFLGLPSAAEAAQPKTAEEEDTPEPPVVIEVGDDPENWNVRELTVRLNPHFEVCGGAVDLVLGLQVPR